MPGAAGVRLRRPLRACQPADGEFESSRTQKSSLQPESFNEQQASQTAGLRPLGLLARAEASGRHAGTVETCLVEDSVIHWRRPLAPTSGRDRCPVDEPHTGTPQVGWDARERPSRKTRPVNIPAWVPYTGPRADAFGFFRSPRRKGSSASPCLYRCSRRVQPDRDRGRPQSTPVDAQARGMRTERPDLSGSAGDRRGSPGRSERQVGERLSTGLCVVDRLAAPSYGPTRQRPPRIFIHRRFGDVVRICRRSGYSLPDLAGSCDS